MRKAKEIRTSSYHVGRRIRSASNGRPTQHALQILQYVENLCCFLRQELQFHVYHKHVLDGDVPGNLGRVSSCLQLQRAGNNSPIEPVLDFQIEIYARQ